MKRSLIALLATAVMLIAAVAFARPFGMMDGRNATPEQQKFFEQTLDLRKQMHDKRFELMELSRRADADSLKVADLENQINTLRARIQEKAKEMNVAIGCGNCAERPSCRDCAGYNTQDCPGPCGSGMQAQRGHGRMQEKQFCR